MYKDSKVQIRHLWTQLSQWSDETLKPENINIHNNHLRKLDEANQKLQKDSA